MANRFWVGGTRTWDATTQTHWSTTTGPGNAPQTAPGSGDVAIFDGNSGGGTVTVNWASGTVGVQAITCGAFTGTLDFSANNNNVNLSASTAMSGTGSGTRTINLGNGTWTMTGAAGSWDFTTTTNLTFNANSSIITWSGNSANGRSFTGGGLTYATLSIPANTSAGGFTVVSGNTIATLNISAPTYVIFQAAVTQTISNAFMWAGSSSSQIGIRSNTSAAAATISVASGAPTMSWVGLRDLTFSGGATFTATNSFNLGGNSGITITVPVTSGGGGIISS